MKEQMTIVMNGEKIFTVNLENFVRVVFSRNFAYAKFPENKILANGKIILPITDIGKSCHSHELLTSQICFLTLFAKIKNSQKKFQIYSMKT